MQIKKYSNKKKMFSFLRHLVIKAILFKTVKFKGLALVGSAFKIYTTTKNSRIFFGKKVILSDNVSIESNNAIILLGDNCTINSYSRIVAYESIKIGSNVTIAQHVAILDHDHKYYLKYGELSLDGYTSSPIIIGSNVWIGDKVTILKGVSIGDNVIIGANSLVTHDIPSYTIAAGVPAKLIKTLSDDYVTNKTL